MSSTSSVQAPVQGIIRDPRENFWKPCSLTQKLFEEITAHTNIPEDNRDPLMRITQAAFRGVAIYFSIHTVALLGIGYNFLGALRSGAYFLATGEEFWKGHGVEHLKKMTIEAAIALITLLPMTAGIPGFLFSIAPEAVTNAYQEAGTRLDQLTHQDNTATVGRAQAVLNDVTDALARLRARLPF